MGGSELVCLPLASLPIWRLKPEVVNKTMKNSKARGSTLARNKILTATPEN